MIKHKGNILDLIDRASLQAGGVVVFFAVIYFLVLFILHVQEPPVAPIEVPFSRSEFQQLHKKHGYPETVVIEHGRAWYTNEKGQRCAFK